jgi:hypothetical protein
VKHHRDADLNPQTAGIPQEEQVFGMIIPKSYGGL